MNSFSTISMDIIDKGVVMLLRFLLILLSTSLLFAIVINVPGDSETIQGGITLAVNGDTIVVAPGTYSENIDFDGKAIYLTSHHILDQDTAHVSSTIISGTSLNSSTVSMTSCVDTNSVLNGFTITGGRGTYVGQWNGTAGGGVLLIGSGKITNNRIMGNHISGNMELDGGGVLIYTGASETGTNGVAILDNNYIAFNTLNGSDLVLGGGISVGGRGSTLISNNVIANNSISASSIAVGGGLSLLNTTDVTVKQNRIILNSIEVDDPINVISGGGGVFLGESTPNFYKNLIADNTAPAGGGLLAWGDDEGFNFRLVNNTIADNVATGKGGGLFLTNGHCTAINNIIWGNTATVDSGIYYRGILDLSYSISQSTQPGSGNLQMDPLFEDDAYTLSMGSPAIDAGDPEPRFHDLSDPANPTQVLWPAMGTLTADMGAYGGNDSVFVEMVPYAVYENFLYDIEGDMHYRYAFPLDYDSTLSYPLTIVLHGAGQFGSDNVSQLYEGLSWRVNAEHYGRNEFTIVPQAPTQNWGSTNIETAHTIIRNMIQEYAVDTTHILVTGWSMGGSGTWRMVNHDPRMFSAAVSVSMASGYQSGTEYTPAWMFHGSGDTETGVGNSRNRLNFYESMGLTSVYAEDSTDVQLMSAIEAGARVLYSEIEGADHNIIKHVWDNIFLFEWLERQTLPLIRPENSAVTYANEDSILFTTSVSNPHGFQFDHNLRIENYDNAHLGDFMIFDDGEHGDGLPLDGIYGNYFLKPDEIGNYRIGMDIQNLDLDHGFYFQNLIPFSTLGPLVYESLEHLYPPGGAISPSSSIYFNLSIRNLHPTAMATDLMVEIESVDSNATVNGGYMDAMVEDIPPGGVGSTLAYLGVITSADCLEESPIYFTIKIKSGGIVFWEEEAVLLGYVGIDEADPALPDSYGLQQNYPNPFNPVTHIQYAIPEKAAVLLRIFDMKGREVVRIDEGERERGYYTQQWDGTDGAGKGVNAGMYFCRLEAGSYRQTIKMVYLR